MKKGESNESSPFLKAENAIRSWRVSNKTEEKKTTTDFETNGEVGCAVVKRIYDKRGTILIVSESCFNSLW